MLWYIIKLVVLLPLIGTLIWGSVRLSRHMQQKLGAPQGGRSVRVVETMMLSPPIRLAELDVHGREILVSTSRTGLARLAEAPARGDGRDGSGGEPTPGENSNDAEHWLSRSHIAPADGAAGPSALRGATARLGSSRPETFSQTLRRFK